MGMGKKLDALLRRSFKTSKFKATVALAVSRSAVLKNQRRARCSVAQSDVIELLKTSYHERALLRVEQVIKEQNMLDVLVMLEGYFQLLVERINLFEQDKSCPEELKEAVSSLIFASTRCGEFPELQEIRAIFTSRFGKEFATRAVELRNHCGVSPKIIQKLSTRSPSLENKLKVLKEIASENYIDLPDETLSGITMKPSLSSQSAVSSPQWDKKPMENEEMATGEDPTGSFKLRRAYTDVADAAQAAFESAAYAAEAARAAVELSRSESTDPEGSPNLRPSKIPATVHDPMETHGENLWFQKIHPEGSFKDAAKGMEQIKPRDGDSEFKRSFSGSSSDSMDDNVRGFSKLSDEEKRFKKNDDKEDEQRSWVPGWMNGNIAQGGLETESRAGSSPAKFEAEESNQTTVTLNINRRPISVRTRRPF